MIFWALFYFFRHSFAYPLSPSPPTHGPISWEDISNVPLCKLDTAASSNQDTRSIYQLVLSCLATLLSCTWVAVQPNIAAHDDPGRRVLLRKIKIAFHLILAPENVILWAAKQRLDAKFLANKYSTRRWTVTHGFFLLMGGYTLWSPAPPSTIHTKTPTPSTFIRVLTHEDLDKLFNSSKPQVNFPILSRDEIMDRSKADSLAKVVVLAQTSWFIANCVGRLAVKLPLSELEVMTLAYATLSGLIFALWWDKPTDVRFPIKVHLLDEGLVGKWATVPTPIVPPHRRSVWRRTLGWLHTILVRPFQTFARDYGVLLAGIREFPADAHRVPTFFSPELRRPHLLKWMLLFDTVGFIFGGIHLMAWSSFFPTEAEKWLWRVCALLVGGGCTLACLLIVCSGVVRKSTNENDLFAGVEGILIVVNSVVYITARFILLVLPWIQLRGGTRADAAMWVDLDWTQFLVHFG